MQRTRLDLKKTDYLRKNYIYITLILLFIIGMFYGSMVVKMQSQELSQRFSLLTQGYSYESGRFIHTLFTTFLSNTIFLLIPYFAGYGAVFQLASAFVPLFKGLGLGLTMGSIYQSDGLSGIVYSVLIIIPHTAVALIAILIGCRESIKMSNLFFKSIRHSDCLNIEIIKLYNVKFIVLTAISFISALINAISMILFLGIFK